MKKTLASKLMCLVLMISLVSSSNVFALTANIRDNDALDLADTSFWEAYEQLIQDINEKVDWSISDDAIPIDEEFDDDFYFNVDDLEYDLTPEETHDLITNGRILGDGVPINPYEVIQSSGTQAAQTLERRWGSGTGKTHQHIIEQAFVMLSNDKPYTYNFYLNNSAAAIIKQYADWPDSNEMDIPFPFHGHFGDLDQKNFMGWIYPTTYTRFSSHYNDALAYYRSGNKTEAWRSLGKALHYIGDASEYHHATNKTILDSDHSEYEQWVDARLLTPSFNWSSIGSSFYTAVNSTTLTNIVYSATHNASQNSTDTMTYTAVTQATLTYAESITAAVLYRFEFDTTIWMQEG